ncbi:hypothetical protein CAPTEDRAFT_66908, partial [Capitella teleta]
GSYPEIWRFAKLVILFKKGARNSCDNCRDISLMDSLVKAYDVILNRRLSRW